VRASKWIFAKASPIYLEGNGSTLDISSGYGSQKSGARMARACALSKRLGSSSSSVNDLVWPYPGFGRGSDNTDTAPKAPASKG
jgi:hypothetical protein